MRRRALLRMAGLGAGLGSASALASREVGRASAQAEEEGFAPLGSLTVPGTKEGVVGPDGRYAYLAVTDGFAVVDLADPGNPELVFENRSPLAEREDATLRMVYDVKHDAATDLLAVVGPANPTGGDAFYGLVTYDVSDPATPSLVAVHETSFFNHNCDIKEGIVYLCGNDGGDRNALVTVDGETGERLGSWSIVSVDERWSRVRAGNWVLHDVSVSEGIAYLAHWDAGTWMVDVSDPSEPSLVAKVRGREPGVFLDMGSDVARRESLEPPGNDHYAARGPGDVVGISVESWRAQDSDGGPGSVYLYDVSDPEAATRLAELPPPSTDDPTYGGTWTTSHNFEFSDDLLFTSWYAGGVKVHDVSDPSRPVELAHWRDESAWFWAAQAATSEFFVGTSLGNSVSDTSARSPDAGLYTFPVVTEPLGAGTATVTSTSTTTPTPTATPTSTATSTPTVTPTSTATPTPTDTRSPSATPTDADTDTPTDPETTTGDGSGFGLGLGALGLGLGLSLRRRLRDREP